MEVEHVLFIDDFLQGDSRSTVSPILSRSTIVNQTASHPSSSVIIIVVMKKGSPVL